MMGGEAQEASEAPWRFGARTAALAGSGQSGEPDCWPATRRLGKGVGFDDLREHYEQVEISHRLPDFAKFIPGFPV